MKRYPESSHVIKVLQTALQAEICKLERAQEEILGALFADTDFLGISLTKAEKKTQVWCHKGQSQKWCHPGKTEGAMFFWTANGGWKLTFNGCEARALAPTGLRSILFVGQAELGELCDGEGVSVSGEHVLEEQPWLKVRGRPSNVPVTRSPRVLFLYPLSYEFPRTPDMSLL